MEQVSPSGIMWLSPEVLFLEKGTNKLISLFLSICGDSRTRRQVSFNAPSWYLDKFEEVCRTKLSHLKLKESPYKDFLKEKGEDKNES